jgi:hypothetical protein
MELKQWNLVYINHMLMISMENWRGLDIRSNR